MRTQMAGRKDFVDGVKDGCEEGSADGLEEGNSEGYSEGGNIELA